jgi:hypothetical protein
MPKISELSASSAIALRDKSGGRVLLSQYGDTSRQDNQVAFAQALSELEPGGVIVIDALFPVNGSCIINKPCTLEGGGPATGFIASSGFSRQYHIIIVASSDVSIDNFRVSGADGDLTLGEPSGIHIHDPTLPQQGGIMAFSEVRISRMQVDDCVCGIRIGYQADGTIEEIRYSSNVVVSACHIFDCSTFGVEVFYSRNTIITGNLIKMRAATINGGVPIQGVRFVGASTGIITGNEIVGPSSQNTAGRGVELGVAVAYGFQVYRRVADSLQVVGNTFSKWYADIYISDSRGHVAVQANVFVGDDDSAESCAAVSLQSGLANSLVTSLYVCGNQAIKKQVFYTGRGNARHIVIDGNSHIGNAQPGRFAFIDQSSTTSIKFFQITNNTSIVNNLVGGGTLRVINTKVGEFYRVSGNNFCPDSSGSVLSQSGAVTIPPFANENTVVPTSVWTEYAAP